MKVIIRMKKKIDLSWGKGREWTVCVAGIGVSVFGAPDTFPSTFLE